MGLPLGAQSLDTTKGWAISEFIFVLHDCIAARGNEETDNSLDFKIVQFSIKEVGGAYLNVAQAGLFVGRMPSTAA